MDESKVVCVSKPTKQHRGTEREQKDEQKVVKHRGNCEKRVFTVKSIYSDEYSHCTHTPRALRPGLPMTSLMQLYLSRDVEDQARDFVTIQSSIRHSFIKTYQPHSQVHSSLPTGPASLNKTRLSEWRRNKHGQNRCVRYKWKRKSCGEKEWQRGEYLLSFETGVKTSNNQHR